MSSWFDLPNVDCSPYYPPDFWRSRVHPALTGLARSPGWTQLEQAIRGFHDEAESVSLGFDNLKSAVDEDFLIFVLPRLCEVALRLPELFPLGRIHKLQYPQTSEIRLRSDQCLCLLSHMFFCTLRPSVTMQTDLYSVAQTNPHTFVRWFDGGKEEDNPSLKYLFALLRYFETALLKEEKRNETVFRLNRNGREINWEESEIEITRINVLVNDFNLGSNFSLESEDSAAVCHEMVFSNRQPGFGAGSSQEEAMVGTEPEALLVGFIAAPLADDESVSVSIPHSSTTSHGSRNLLFIDAQLFSGLPGENRIEQLAESSRRRELAKLCSFAPEEERGRSERSSASVATGHWGCGAFGGDVEIKAVLQIMAFSQMDYSLVYYACHGNDSFARSLSDLAQCLALNKVTVGFLAKVLAKASEKMGSTAQTLSWRKRADDSPFLFHMIKQEIMKSGEHI